MERGTWHYHRPELAERYLRRFDPGPAEALTLFAERRSGKTAFLQNHLGVVALDQKLQPVYIDLMSNRADPGRAIADGLEAAARRVKDPRYKFGVQGLWFLGHGKPRSFDEGSISTAGEGWQVRIDPSAPGPASPALVVGCGRASLPPTRSVAASRRAAARRCVSSWTGREGRPCPPE